MKLDGFALAATTNDLDREVDARGVADVVEFRMDSAEDPIGQLSDYEGDLPIIATNRTKWFGGEANDTGRLDRLSAASRFDAVELVDIELETARGMGWILDEFRQNDVDIIISHHDFDDTPEQDVLDAIIEQCAQYGDVAKVATYPQNHDDVLRLLKAINTASNDGIDVAGIAMGGLGSHSRVVGPLYGSTLGYAPLAEDTSEYAPGQIPVRKLAALIEALQVASEDVTEMDSLAAKLAEQQTHA
ncbi:type I 3-dehydroquinate dehydratase (plasmid) [Halarchaeum sp. CBA1220]|uniref:type I 3-dehydroquinate dehydratase n=1 Tax=Halarchaeum sp. CBA1220 TaxID=1853682 RepID=UPI000F3A8D30|nr:type I 3-dehydroquinate dehydratase [Halarchaeum sp. CBA1220]QLC35278.1 type I 3-dehydroquinate dehydratase [Halarchaeum sp. CBA1220]